jgi:hypothetical protein
MKKQTNSRVQAHLIRSASYVLGEQTLYLNVSGDSNTAIGFGAFHDNTTLL